MRDQLTILDSQQQMWRDTALAPNREMTTAISNSQNNKVMVQIYLDQHIPAGLDVNDASFRLGVYLSFSGSGALVCT